MKQTAVEWLEEQLPIYGYNVVTVFPELIEQAKEMEKQQRSYSEEEVLKAYCSGADLDFDIMISTKEGIQILKEWFEQFKNK